MFIKFDEFFFSSSGFSLPLQAVDCRVFEESGLMTRLFCGSFSVILSIYEFYLNELFSFTIILLTWWPSCTLPFSYLLGFRRASPLTSQCCLLRLSVFHMIAFWLQSSESLTDNSLWNQLLHIIGNWPWALFSCFAPTYFKNLVFISLKPEDCTCF